MPGLVGDAEGGCSLGQNCGELAVVVDVDLVNGT